MGYKPIPYQHQMRVELELLCETAHDPPHAPELRMDLLGSQMLVKLWVNDLQFGIDAFDSSLDSLLRVVQLLDKDLLNISHQLLKAIE